MKIVFLTGAGISKESGIDTFRDSDGLWENHKVEDVAHINGWRKDRELVLNFYNHRRTQLANVEPNNAHRLITKIAEDHDVYVITQNVDDLHERAGNPNILHLHGQLTKVKGCSNATDSIDIGYTEINIGDKASDGSQLRPDIVWFGEAVPNMTKAVMTIGDADVIVIVGTSMIVYPAAGLIDYAPGDARIVVINPEMNEGTLLTAERLGIPGSNMIALPATEGMHKFYESLILGAYNG